VSFAAPKTYVGTFTLPTAGTTGAQTVSGIVDSHGAAFIPKAIIIWGNRSGKFDGGSQSEWDSFGVDDGTTHVGQAIVSQWAFGIPWRGVACSDSYSIVTVHPIFSAGYNTLGYVSGFGSGNFTYTLDANPDGGFVFGYMAIGGSDLLTKVILTEPGNYVGDVYTQTGVGFTPTGAVCVNNIVGPNNDVFGALLAIGFVDSALNMTAMCAGLVDAHSPALAYRALHTATSWVRNVNTTPVANNEFAFTAWTSDGFTGLKLQPTVGMFGALLVGGCGTVVGAFDQPASDGAMSLSVPGMLPSGVLLGSVGATEMAGSTIAADESWSVGAFDGTRAWAYWHGALNGSDPSTNGGAQWGAADALLFAQNNGATSAAIIEQGILAGGTFSTDTITGTWTQCDGTERRIMFFAFGTGASPAPDCTGGGAIVVIADPLNGPPFSGRNLSPRAWMTLSYDDQNRPLALDSGNHPPASEGRKIGNLVKYGTIRRGLSTHTQPYIMGEASVEVDDTSRLLSGLEAAAPSQYWGNRECRIRVSDVPSIASGVIPWTLFRGIWQTYANDGLSQATLGFTSVLGSQFSDFNLERQIADKKIKDVFDSAPKESQDLTLPIAYGIYPDPGLSGRGDPVANVQVTLASRPAAPTGFTATAVHDSDGVGIEGTKEYYAITALIGGLESDPAYASVTLSGSDNAADLAWSAYPSATQINVYSAVRSDFYQFAFLTTALAGASTSYRDLAVLANQDVGELAKTGRIWTLGERINVTWYVYAQLADGTFSQPGVSTEFFSSPIRYDFRRRDMTVTWSAYTGAVKYYALRYITLYSNWNPRFDLQLTCIPPTTTVSDVNNDDALIIGSIDPPNGQQTAEAPTGTIPAIPCGKETIGGVQYNRLVISIGAWRHVEAIFTQRAVSSSDTQSAGTQEPIYDRVADSDYGTTWLAYGQAGWPFPNAYVEYNGVWTTVIFTTIDPLPTKVLVNGCGLTDVSDGTGSTIDGAARQFYHILENFVLPPADESWISGAWLSPRTFGDGTPVVNTGSLAELETIEISRIGRYYRGQLYIDAPMALRDFLANIFTSWNIRVGENEHGQVIGKHLDEFEVLSGVPHLTDRADLVGNTKIDRRLIQELENYIPYDYAYRPARTGQYLFQNQSQSDATAITANRGRRAIGTARQMRFVDDPVTAVDVIGRDLTYGKYVPVYVTIPISMEALFKDYGMGRFIKLGSIITVTDVEGIGATGWVNRPMWVMEVAIALNDLQTPPDIELICVDVKRILDGAGEMWDQDVAVDWGSAAATDRGTYMFMADQSTGQLPDGTPAKEMR
jgi:hypothetical protein